MPRPEPRPDGLVFRPLTPARWRDLEDLFGPNGACGGCWCMWWKQDRARFREGKGERNRRAFRRVVKSGAVPGLLAYAGGEPVGWVAVEPRSRYPRLARSRTLAAVDAEPVWSAPCFFVARRFRRRGLTGRLLQAAAEHVRRRGGRILEAYPVDSSRKLSGAELYRGAYSTFVRLGFAEVARRSRTRPVVRLGLGRRRPRP
jgi:GNAT superfamily N-acetyltransferase